MFCPVCKAEYRLGFTHCSDCDVDLVESLPASQAPNDLALAWRGSDPVSFSAALAALRDANIPSYQLSDHDQLVWGLAIPRPRYEILVRKQDLQRALELVNGISERPAFALGKTPEWAFEEPEPAESGGRERSVDQSGAQNEVPDDLVPKFRAKDANLEVWSGEETDMGQMLEASLRENGIGCVVDSAGGVARVRVLPEFEARAREIVREVLEGTPPD